MAPLSRSVPQAKRATPAELAVGYKADQEQLKKDAAERRAAAEKRAAASPSSRGRS
jgi:hypothetical protein